MADAIIGASNEVDAVKQDLIANLVQKELAFASKMGGLYSDMSRFAVKGQQSVSFPKLDSFTVADRAEGVAGNATVLSSSAEKLDLNIRGYVAWLIDSSSSVQSTIDYEMEAAARAASGMGRYIDSKIITALEAGSTATATAGDISRDIVLELREAYLSAYGDLNEASLIISVDQETAMLKVNEFTRADVYAQQDAVVTGMIGRVYGVPVIVHNGLAAQTFYFGAKSGLAYAIQSGPNMSRQPANEYGALAERVAMDILMGVKILQGGALSFKDNN